MTKQLILTTAILLGLLMSCSPTKKSNIVVKTEDGSDFFIEYQIDTAKQVKQGYYKMIMKKDSAVVLEQEYLNDTLVGTEKAYHPSGSLKSEFKIEQGVYEGPFKYYYPDGKTYQEGVNIAGEIEGELKTYYPNGALKETVTMAKTVENGPFVEYYDNGKLKAKGTYKDGKEHCLLEMYKEDASGELEFKKLCRNGSCCTVWAADGKLNPLNELCKDIVKEMTDSCQYEEE